MRDTKLEVLLNGGTDRCTSLADNYIAYTAAVANSFGGDLYFLPGKEEMLPEEASCLIKQIEARIKQQICPTPDFSITGFLRDGKPCLRLHVQESGLKPVRLLEDQSVCLLSEGTLRKASSGDIPLLEKHRKQEWTEESPAMPVNVDSIRSKLNSAIPAGASTLRKSNLIEAGLLKNRTSATNALLLCSDDAPDYSAVVVNLKFAARTFHGPVYNLVEAPLEFIIRTCNQPLPAAVKEALVNALCHRDYSIEKPVELTFQDRLLTLVSPGRLLSAVSPDPVGKARSRNPSIVWVFRCMQLATGWGTGLKRIMDENQEFKPRFYETRDSFVFELTLPSLNKDTDPFKRRESIIIAYIQEHGYIKNSDGQTLLGLSESSIVKLFASMVKKGLIVSRGERKARVYILP